MIKLAIFDLDGVLIDCSDAIVKAFNQGLTKVGLPIAPTTDIESMIGIPLMDMYAKYADSKQVKQCFDIYQEVFLEFSKDNTIVFEGVYDVLQTLAKHHILRVAATNKEPDMALGILKQTELINKFDKIYTLDSPNTTKNNMIKAALEDLSIDKGAAIIIGDTKSDIIGAKEAGIKSIGITTGFGTIEELEASGADYIISDLKELIEIVNKE